MARPVLLRGGLLIDGSGRPGARRDLAFNGRQIVAPDRIDPGDAEVVDVEGLAVSPGFIDVHTHSDAITLQEGGQAGELSLAAARQGVTLEIVGNCGYSMFPGPTREELRPQLDELGSAIFGEPCRGHDTLAEYAASQRLVGRVNHLATLVGHSTLRTAVSGFAQRTLRDDELDRMLALLDAALAGGAVGWSSGLIYPPGSYAPRDELIAMARVSTRHGVPYVTHMRDEMRGVVDALGEALEIAGASGSPLHLSHHKTAGKYAAGKSRATLEMMDEARARGLDVTCDVYPYTAGSTNLHAMLPPWTAEGGLGALLERITDPLIREQIRHDIEAGTPGWENTVGNGGWHLIDVASAPHRPETLGKSIAELAAATRQDPLDFALDLLLAEDGLVTIISRTVEEADMRRILAHPGTMIGSDGVPRGGKPHPRWAGTFARVLGNYVREEGVLELEEAVRRMTALPARRFGLAGRGSLDIGGIADLVVFDPERIADRATFADPLLPPVGVERVFVSGQQVFCGGYVSAARPGEVVARGSDEEV